MTPTDTGMFFLFGDLAIPGQLRQARLLKMKNNPVPANASPKRPMAARCIIQDKTIAPIDRNQNRRLTKAMGHNGNKAKASAYLGNSKDVKKKTGLNIVQPRKRDRAHACETQLLSLTLRWAKPQTSRRFSAASSCINAVQRLIASSYVNPVRLVKARRGMKSEESGMYI